MIDQFCSPRAQEGDSVFFLIFIYLFGCTGSQLWFSESLIETYTLLVVACGTQFPDQGSNPGPLHWEHGVLATTPPGKSTEALPQSLQWPFFETMLIPQFTECKALQCTSASFSSQLWEIGHAPIINQYHFTGERFHSQEVIMSFIVSSFMI